MTDDATQPPVDGPDGTDEQQAAVQPGDGAAPARRRPSPGVQAASRARRIGGRPLPGPRSSSEPDSGIATTATAEPAPALAEPTADLVPSGSPELGKDEAAALRRKLDRLRWVPAGVAAAVAIALAVLLVSSSHGVWWAKPSTAKVRGQVLAAAKTCLAKTNSFDYRKIDEAEAAGLQCATGKFRDSYKQAMETVVKKVAPERKATQTVQVNKAGIESVSKDGKQWVVLIYGQQQVTNNTSADKQPRLDILAAKVTMDKVGDKWLISALSAA